MIISGNPEGIFTLPHCLASGVLLAASACLFLRFKLRQAIDRHQEQMDSLTKQLTKERQLRKHAVKRCEQWMKQLTETQR